MTDPSSSPTTEPAFVDPAFVDPAFVDPAFVDAATVVVDRASVWFSQHVVLSELSCSFGPGVTGLLGPNGAGKTTLMRAICGMLPTNDGSVQVLGRNPRTERDLHASIALVPEDEAVPAAVTPRELARYRADLAGVDDVEAWISWGLSTVDLVDVADRELGGFSKGMRQRAKIAAALVTNPQVLVLDEPLNGADPVQRRALIALFKRLGDEGRTVIVSSHVLHEVERLAPRILVMRRGRLAAAGTPRAIRDAMADRPRRILVRSNDDRALAALLVADDSVGGVHLVPGGGIEVASTRAATFARRAPALARGASIHLAEVLPLDDSLDSLFEELTR